MFIAIQVEALKFVWTAPVHILEQQTRISTQQCILFALGWGAIGVFLGTLPLRVPVRFGIACLSCVMRTARLWKLFESTGNSLAVTVNLPITLIPFVVGFLGAVMARHLTISCSSVLSRLDHIRVDFEARSSSSSAVRALRRPPAERRVRFDDPDSSQWSPRAVDVQALNGYIVESAERARKVLMAEREASSISSSVSSVPPVVPPPAVPLPVTTGAGMTPPSQDQARGNAAPYAQPPLALQLQSVPRRSGVSAVANFKSEEALLKLAFDEPDLAVCLAQSRISMADMQLQQSLGQGSFGVVYEGRAWPSGLAVGVSPTSASGSATGVGQAAHENHAAAQRVAIKLIHRHCINVQQLDNFKRAVSVELRLAQHAHIVQLCVLSSSNACVDCRLACFRGTRTPRAACCCLPLVRVTQVRMGRRP